jgi:imidazolonepropionase-like amidohydrolase
MRKPASPALCAGIALLAIVCTSAHGQEPAAAAMPVPILIRNARVFDGHSTTLREGAEIRIEGNRIVSIGAATTEAGNARVIDAAGRVVMPGLIDAHAHLSNAIPTAQLRDTDPAYVTARAIVEARRTLLRGFTTIRDTGGPAFGLKQAIDDGTVEGPRIFPSGAPISQTSGHGDHRLRTMPSRHFDGARDPLEAMGFGLVADGPDEVRAAVREQLRLGATQIKLMAGGGISSNYDPIDSVQYSPEELSAAVRAAADWGTYVTVHAYTSASIRRSIEAGVRCIEHAHLIDEPTMRLLAEKNVFLSTQALLFSGALANAFSQFGTRSAAPADVARRAKSEMVSAGLDQMMALAKRHRVKIALGTDLFGPPALFAAQARELGARLKWFSSPEILIQATGNNGELLALSGPRNPYGRLGVLEAGALADLLIVEGNPLEDVRVLEDEKNLRFIIKDGKVYKEPT